MRLYYASDYAIGVNTTVPPLIITQGFSGTSTQSATVQFPTDPFKSIGSRSIQPLATNAPIRVGAGTTVDASVTPSVVTVNGDGSVTFTASYSNAHGNGTIIASASIGLQEALNDASKNGGGAVIVDGRWAQLGGTTALITAAANGNGTSGVFIMDMRGTALNQYTWNGTAWTAGGAASFPSGANGQALVPFLNTENLTLSTSGTTTDTTANLLPANSLILVTQGTVSTTIVTATDWKLGDATTAGRFSAADSTLTAGEAVPKTSFPPVQIGTGVANATTGVYQAAAAKVRITTTGTPSAGAIRVTVYGFTLTNATS